MTVPTFIDARLDEGIEENSEGGPTFLTTIIELASGAEKRNIEWQYPRIEWNISYGIRNPDDLADVMAMFNNCYGRGIAFRFKDWSDFLIGNLDTGAGQQIGIGDGTTLIFQAYRNYTVTGIDGSTLYTVGRKITRLVQGTLSLWVGTSLKVEGTDFTVDYDTGLITFAVAPANNAIIYLYCEFDVPVRFDTDLIKMKLIWTGAGTIPPIVIKEVRE